MSRISVALATFNGAQFLPQQLDSYLAQDRLPDELVVGDDGSSDGTLALLEDFAKAAPFPVRILDSPSAGGIAANFERTIAACSGDWVFLSDQDDIWLPSKIATVEKALKDAPEVLALHHDEWLMDSDSGAIFPETFNQRARRMGGWDFLLFVGNCTVLRREALDILLPIPPGIAFDYWLARLPELLGARAILDEPLQYWRRHGTNNSQAAIAERTAPGKIALARRFAAQDPRSGWETERETLKLFADRIDSQASRIDDLLGAGRSLRAARDIRSRMEAITRRCQRLSESRLRRLPSVARAFAGGDYRYFSGWRSALKDAMRRA